MTSLEVNSDKSQSKRALEEPLACPSDDSCKRQHTSTIEENPEVKEIHTSHSSENKNDSNTMNHEFNSKCNSPDGESCNIDCDKTFNGVEISKLTKRQMKKYKKCLKWKEVKKEKRVRQKIKNKERRIFAQKNNIDLGPSRKALKKLKMVNSTCKIGVCIDLSFDHLMIDKDMAKTIKQLLRVYTENRRASSPLQLHICDFSGRSKQEMSKHHGYEHWDIFFHSGSYIDLFPKDKLVYLTSESDNVITELEQDKVYVIGGLVDHNAHKGICYNKAVEQGIAHGQLPIGEYFKVKRRKVLTINQVFEILLRVSEGKSFKEALQMILPKRIDVQQKQSDTDEDSDTKQSQSVESVAEGTVRENLPELTDEKSDSDDTLHINN